MKGGSPIIKFQKSCLEMSHVRGSNDDLRGRRRFFSFEQVREDGVHRFWQDVANNFQNEV